VKDAGLFEIMRTMGARRRFLPQPVTDDHVMTVIEAATLAASGKNEQPWSFLVVRDPPLRAKIGALYREAWYETMPAALSQPPADESEARARRNWRYLADHMGDAPALIFCCSDGPPPSDPFRAASYYGSVFPAIQNLMLAARAVGLGTTLTTVHKAREPALKELLGVPKSLDLVALIPMGYPVNPFGSVRRRPASEVTHFDRWQNHRG
jgi:nitroreductase